MNIIQRIRQSQADKAKAVAKQVDADGNTTDDKNDDKNNVITENVQAREEGTGDLLNITGTGEQGERKEPKKYEGEDACADPNSAKCKEWKAGYDRCKENPDAEGCSGYREFEFGEKGDSNVSFDSSKQKQEASAGSSMDLFGPREVRRANRAMKIAQRKVGEAEKKLKRMKNRGLEGTARYQAQMDALDDAKNRVANVKEQGRQFRNRSITYRTEYGRALDAPKKEGYVKAPEDMQTDTEFKEDFTERVTGGSGGVSTPQTNLSEALSNVSNPTFTSTTDLFSNFGNPEVAALNKGASSSDPLAKYGLSSQPKAGAKLRTPYKMGGFGSKTYKK